MLKIVLNRVIEADLIINIFIFIFKNVKGLVYSSKLILLIFYLYYLIIFFNFAFIYFMSLLYY